VSAVDSGPETDGRSAILAPHADQRNAGRALDEPELEAALQLLVERAQYITGATGTALALLKGDEMVCCASTGSCAPAVGARLQVSSGLTGESIASRRMLRCENAESDPRVNLQACRTLGIASIVVLPLLRPNGELRGLFELFSDHAYAFEERDLIALDRMADLTLTALDLAEERHGDVPPHAGSEHAAVQIAEPAPEITSQAEKVAVIPPLADVPSVSVEIAASTVPSALEAAEPEGGDVGTGLTPSRPDQPPAELSATPLPETSSSPEASASASLSQAMDRIRKCGACGFPVSEGRTLCIDCEEKQTANLAKAPETSEPAHDDGSETEVHAPDDSLPLFLANAAPVKESWLVGHIPLVTILVIMLGVLVAFLVLR
jgi:hypothetical protein